MNIPEFLTELSALTRKHGIRISSCGCCDSPYLLPVEPEHRGEEYKYKTEDDGVLLIWTAADSKDLICHECSESLTAVNAYQLTDYDDERIFCHDCYLEAKRNILPD